MENEIQKTKGNELALSKRGFRNLRGEIVKYESGSPKWLQVVNSVSNERELFLLKEKGEIDIRGIKRISKENPSGAKLELLKMLRKIGIALNAENLYSEEMVEIFFDSICTSEEFYFLSLSDIWLALKRGSQGVYSKVYGAPNLLTLFEWLRGYEAARMEALHNQRGQDSQAHKIDAPRGDASLKSFLKNLS